MGKLFKILGIFIGAVLLLVVAASVILPLVVDPNDFKGEIVKQVNEQTGRDLIIAGDLNLSVFPWLGIKIDGVELSNAKGFGKQPFVSVKHAAVRVKLMPLINKKLEVDTIGLDGVTLNLARNKDGNSNWDDLANGKEGKAAADKDKKADKAGSSSGLEGLSIGGVDISDARISWDDRQSGRKYEISEFNLKSGAIVAGSPVGLDMGMMVMSKDPALKAMVDLNGTIELDEAKGQLNIADLKLSLDANGAALPKGSLKAELETVLMLALDGQSMSLQNLRVKSGDLNLTGNLKGENLSANAPAFSGNLTLAEFNPRNWMISQGMALPNTSDPKALSRLSASLNLSSKGQSTNLNKLAIQLDDTKITGNAIMRGAAVAFKLAVDAIDMDRYMPVSNARSAKGNQTGAKTASGNEQLFPVDDLRKLDLNGSLNIGRLITNKLLAEGVLVTIKAKDGQVQTTQKVSKFYNGSYSGKVNINVSGKTPLVQLDSNLSKVHLGPLIKQLANEDRLTGEGHFMVDISASGNSEGSLRQTLNGKLDLKFLQGAVKGINLADELRKAKALLSGKSATSSKGPVQTDFSQITASGVVKNGVLNNSDLQALSPFLRITGKGVANLVRETLDYTALVFIVETSKGQGGHDLAALEELKRSKIGVPVRFSGPLASPKWEVQWQKVLLEMKKDELKSKLEEKLLGKDKAKDGEKGSAKDQLKEKLFKKLF